MKETFTVLEDNISRKKILEQYDYWLKKEGSKVIIQGGYDNFRIVVWTKTL